MSRAGQKLVFALEVLCPAVGEAVSNYKEHAILWHRRQRKVENYKCLTNRLFYAYHKVLNWNSLQGLIRDAIIRDGAILIAPDK